jgi:hypothetical protein
MEAKELMVCDLCCEWNNDRTEKHVVKVAQIQKEGVRDIYNVFHENDWIEPIPLTVEIFEKNEFERNTFNGTIIFSKKSCVDIDWYDVIVEIGKDAEGIQRWDCVCIKIQKAGANLTLNNQSCFHELQHALCLVGLNEVADNLKVE